MQTMFLRAFALSSLSLLSLVSCGIGDSYRHDGEHGVSAGQFSDIPVPAGMRLQERFHKSSSVAVGNFRRASMVYEGSLSIEEASAYMRERMPHHSWALERRETGEKDLEELRFRRGSHVVTCSIRRKELTTTMMVNLRTES